MSDNLNKIVEEIEKLTVLEIAELVKGMEEKFGVTAQILQAGVAGPVPAGVAEPTEEKTNFNVELTNMGANKIAVIKAVREVVPTLGLAEAKTLVESAPKVVLENANKATAEEAKKKLEAAGATVELK